MASASDPVKPEIHPTSILAPGAVAIGQVTIERDCFIGPNCVLRGDIEPIVVERGSNLQDNVTVHTHKGSPVTVGQNVSVGHGAVLHGGVLEPWCLVGMNAVVLDHAVVGERSVVGALSLVPAGFKVPPRSLAVGIPCKVVKQNDLRIAQMAEENAKRYHVYREEYLDGRWRTVVGPHNDGGVFGR